MAEETHAVQEFQEYIRSGEDPRMADVEVLRHLAEQFPWFTTVRMMLARAEGQPDARLELPLLCRPVPAFFLERIDREEFSRRTTEEIIDSFLDYGEYRIVPRDETPQAGPEQEPALPDGDEFVSEELAQIYLAQGLTVQARQIYSRLCLLYPEKSVYFAQIIGRINGKDLNKEE